jgi:CubicO group peptidase (beta-lactamase class C family)
MRRAGFLIAAMLALVGMSAAAQRLNPLAPPVTTEVPGRPDSSSAQPPQPQPPVQPQLTAPDVNAWLDGYMPYALANGDIAGAVVVVVRDGQVLAQRGYGFADVKSRRPVDPERTLFRPGSVSKLFTWTAVMQLVEQGKLNLDIDANQYLDFRIPPKDGKPITLRQMMTHTTGFEEQSKNIIGFERDAVPGYAELLKRWVPKRVFTPLTTPAYSNYATSLAGYIVERVSGEPFDDYVQRHIFAPIGMANSTFAQPLPPRMQPMMATGYQTGSGEPVKFEFVGPAPAGSLSATGSDMGRFMIAHLNQGAGLLRPETARLMHTTTLPILPYLDRMALGFYQTGINGRRAIAHAGDTVGFHSDLHLLLDDNTGIFVSVNSGGREGVAGQIRTALFEDFADRYFPGARDSRRVPAETAREHARMLTGTFANSRGSKSSFMNLTEMLGQVKVGLNEDGAPVVPLALGLNGQPRRWVEVQPFLWHDLNSHERMAARVVDGEIVRFSLDSLPFMMFDRVPWHRDTAWLMPALLVSLAILLLTVILWPVRALVRRNYGAKLTLEGPSRRAHLLTRVAALLILLVFVGWAVAITAMTSNLALLGPAMDPAIYLLQILGWIAFLGGLAVLAWNLWITWRGGFRWPAKLWSVALLFAAVIAVWVGFAFNFLSFGANY